MRIGGLRACLTRTVGSLRSSNHLEAKALNPFLKPGKPQTLNCFGVQTFRLRRAYPEPKEVSNSGRGCLGFGVCLRLPVLSILMQHLALFFSGRTRTYSIEKEHQGRSIAVDSKESNPGILSSNIEV